MVHDSPIGVLTLYTADQREFTENEIAFLTALAEQGGIAIDRARLIEHIRQNSRLFHDLSAGINASLDFKKIITTLTVDLGRSFKAKGVCVMLLDEDQQTLKPVAVHGIAGSLFSEETLAKDKTIAETLKGETILIPDATIDSGIFNQKAHQKENIVTILSVPIQKAIFINTPGSPVTSTRPILMKTMLPKLFLKPVLPMGCFLPDLSQMFSETSCLAPAQSISARISNSWHRSALATPSKQLLKSLM